MLQGDAAADAMDRADVPASRWRGRRLRRAVHKTMCLIPLYRRRAEREKVARVAAAPTIAPAVASTVKAANAAASVPAARLVPLNDKEAVHRLLGDIKTRGLHATAGKIQLVHLDSVRRRFGSRWPTVSARALAIAEAVLREELDEEDIFTRYENVAFVIVFSMIDDSVAQGRAAAISGRIHDRLMADRELAKVFDVQAVTAPIEAIVKDGAVTPEALAEALEEHVAGHQLTRIRGASALMGDLFIGYQPVFRVAERQIGVFIALPQRKTPEGEVLFGARAFPEGTVITEEFDKLFTDHVINDLLLPVNAGNRRVVGTLMSHYSLSKSARLIYRLGQLPDNMRSRFVVEIVGTPADASPDDLARVVRKLRNVTGHVALRVGLLDAGIERFAECGFRVFCGDLTEPDVASMDAGERDAALAAFVARVKAMEARVQIYGAETAGAIKASILAGADFVSGDAIALCAKKPQPVRPAEF